MDKQKDKANTYRTIAVLLSLFLSVLVSTANAQLRTCEENAQGNILIKNSSTNLKPVKIFEMPDAIYPENARNSGVYGNVTLKVRFLAGGRIGYVSVVSGSDDLLISESIKAAKKINFLPARQNGRMIHIEEVVEYYFPDPRKCSPGMAGGN